MNLWANSVLHSFTTWLDGGPGEVQPEILDGFVRMMHSRCKSDSSISSIVSSYIAKLSKQAESGKQHTSLTCLVNLAAYQGCTIELMLTSPDEAAASNLFTNSRAFRGVPFSRTDLPQAYVRLGYVYSKLLSRPTANLPPPSCVWDSLGLWGSVSADLYPQEHSEYVERYKCQKNAIASSRLIYAVNLLVASQTKSTKKPRVEDLAGLLRGSRLMPRDEAFFCAKIANSLINALSASLNPNELVRADEIRAEHQRSWLEDCRGIER